MVKPKNLPKTRRELPVEFTLKAKGLGTVIWLLAPEPSREFRALSPKLQAAFRERQKRRHLQFGLICLGLIRHPELESHCGPLLDDRLNELSDILVGLIKTPKSTQ